jgi:hypothetical protein
MPEPVGAHGVNDPEVALLHEAETLSHRFPQVPRDELDRRLHAAYDELRRHARIQSHLIALTTAHVTEDLIHHNPQ